jgi:hypothetical protein
MGGHRGDPASQASVREEGASHWAWQRQKPGKDHEWFEVVIEGEHGVSLVDETKQAPVSDTEACLRRLSLSGTGVCDEGLHGGGDRLPAHSPQ